MIVFVATRAHQARYFETLRTQLAFDAEVCSYPRLVPDALLPPPVNAGADLDALVERHMRRRHAKGRHMARPRQRLDRLALRLAAWLHVRHFLHLLGRREVRAVALWNGHGWVQRCAIAAARALGKPVIRFENGLLPGTTTLDAQGVNAENSLPRDAGAYRSLWPGDDSPLSLPVSGIAPDGLPARYVWIPFQIDSDSQILLHSPWIADMRALFALLESLLPLAERLNLAFLCKEHPGSRLVYPDLHARQCARLRFVNGMDTSALIRGALGVVTINSTAGLEALLTYKPVIALGEACYAMPGLAVRGRCVADVAAWLAALDWQRVDHRAVSGFHHCLRTRYCVAGSWSAPDAAHVRAVERRLGELIETDMNGPYAQAAPITSSPRTRGSTPPVGAHGFPLSRE